MSYRWYEKQVDGSLKELTLLGEKVDDDSPLVPLQVAFPVPDPTPPQTPLAPSLSVTQPTRTTTVLVWTPQPFTGPPVTEWDVERRSSTDDGANFGAWAAITGSPFAAATLTAGESGLSTGTPEVIFQYRVRGVNADGDGQWSTTAAVQWNGTPETAPARPTNLAVSNVTATSATLTWTNPTTGSPATKVGIFLGNATTPIVDNIDPAAVAYNWSGLTPGVALQNVNVKRYNAVGWSSGSNWVTFTPTTPINFAPWIGCSNSVRDHGGTNDWDSWRVYDYNDALTIANRTGANHPKVIALTDLNGAGGIWTSYTSAFNTWRDRLDEFYYGGDGSQSGQIMVAGRADVELHIANGNEYGDKVYDGTTAGYADKLAGFVDGCRGIYDATRILNPNGQRRYPLASAWLDPTHYQEQQQDALKEPADAQSGKPAVNAHAIAVTVHAAAPYLDGVAWSMYPPGREATAADPTWDYPSFNESHRYNNNRGYFIRCFMRTYEAQYPAGSQPEFPGGSAMAGNTYLTEFHPLKIAVWEIGIGDDPDDQTTRPWYAVHGMVASLRKLSGIYSLDMATLHWWDNQVGYPSSSNAQNILSDEPAPTGTQISTRTAFQNWKQYSHWDGGSHPAAWNGNPKSTWKNRDAAWLATWEADMSS